MSARPMMDIAVVTSCHNYGRYLGDWAASIIAMTRWPRIIAIVDNGSTDGTPAQVEAAAAALRSVGHADVRMRRIALTDFGTARNAAVKLGEGTEWVMHMDADDAFMKHCLDDVAALAPKADVVALGYERTGDLKAGPSNRTRTYSSSQGRKTLRSAAPASGVSPFRRSFWERSPYRTDMIGGWDTALWIGFAHLNARFLPTKRPCFYYRQHADSIFNTRRIDRRRGRIVGAKLTSLRRQREGVSLLVPRRGDGGGTRDQSWEWIRRRYAAIYPEWEVVEGDCDGGPWRKGVAVARAFEASRGNTIIVADSDCILPKAALEESVRLVESGEAPWVIPHTLVHRLDCPSSARVLADVGAEPPFAGVMDRAPYVGFAGGGFIVIDASAWAATGGMPASFAGWGAEDEATAEILDTLVGPAVRLEYDLWHLWHPHARKKGQVHQVTNRALLNTIRCLAGNPDGMFEVLEKLAAGVPLDAVFAASSGNAVPMIALMDFKRGKQIIKQHHRFLATEEEAKRHDARPRRIAVRVSSGMNVYGKDRTLEIRAEQRMRNEAARAEAEARRAALLRNVGRHKTNR